MGTWGITSRESDYGLDLLGTLAGAQLRQVDFAAFNVSEAIELLRQDILRELKKSNRGCPPEKLDYYINANFQQDFTQALLLIAECLADYYQTGELIVYDYVGEDYTPVEKHVREFTVTGDDLKLLLDELHSVQKPEHWKYQAWIREEDRRAWLAYIQTVQQSLQEHT